MNWEKKGQIFLPETKYEWSQSHAQVPVIDMVNEEKWRIYYASRNKKNQSLIGFIEVEAGNPLNVLYIHKEPILDFGRLGTFDDRGIMPSWILNVDDKKYLYYIGWTTRNTVPYHNSVGIAVSKDGVSFKKLFEGPLLGTTYLEPYFTGTSCVMREKEDKWKIWYLSCVKWEVIEGKPEPFYHIKYAESVDGINWVRNGVVAIDFKSEDEGGIVSASVIKESDKYRMWYSYRQSADYRSNKNFSYRIGYAESKDGILWERLDTQVGISVSEEGWDSEMISYPYVISNNSTKYMFYNGNGFGKTGFGFATLEE